MRVNQISITGLYGMFDHSVSLHLADRITIIHGPNGFGKTALLKLTHAVFETNFDALRTTYFKEFLVEFEEEAVLLITRQVSPKFEHEIRLTFKFTQKGKKPQVKSIDYGDARSTHQVVFPFDAPLRVDRSSGELTDIREELMEYEEMQRTYREYQLLTRRMTSRRSIEEKAVSAWIKQLTGDVSISYIAAQRLLAPNKADNGATRDIKMVEVVGLYAKRLAALIQGKLAEYAALSQRLDRTFPSRVITFDATKSISIEELRAKLLALEERRQRLMSAGILDDDTPLPVQRQQNLEPVRGVLSVYVQDVERKLSVFDDILRRLELFKKIIDDHFSYKSLTISRDKGFVLLSTYGQERGRELVPSGLSSGEQHQLVLLYELLFNVKPGSFILIDEPELSLHVAWQIQFLRDVQAISEVTQADFLIATHSPQIINDRWDLTVELHGPEVGPE